MPVYLFQAGGDKGPVKIGYGSDPQLRLTQCQTGNHLELRIIRLFVGAEAEEQALHQRFAKLHIRGEWHSFSAEMMDDLGLVEIPVVIDEPVYQPIRAGACRALVAYLNDNGIAPVEFATSIDVPFQTLHRYLNGDRIPHRDIMARIVRQTGGKVQPNDFFGIVSHSPDVAA